MTDHWLGKLSGLFSNLSNRRRDRRGRNRMPREPRIGDPWGLPVRPRALSTPPPPRPQRRLRLLDRPTCSASPASTSLLLALPAEIRLQILAYVVSGNTIHLTHRRHELHRVSSILCTHHGPFMTSEFPDSRNCPCVPEGTAPSFEFKLANVIRGKGVDPATLGLLRTCRSIYRETVVLLYSANVFTVTMPRSLIVMRNTVPPQRLALIRDLHLTWAQPVFGIGPGSKYRLPELVTYYEWSGGHDVWGWACNVIATHLTGLRNLKVILHGTTWGAEFGTICIRDVRFLLEPLKNLRGLKSFEVLVLSPIDDCSDTIAAMKKVVCASA